MKIFVLAFLSAFIAASARSCSKTVACPKYWKCIYTAADHSKGTCKLNTMHRSSGHVDYNRANRAFTAVDVDHNKKITFGGAYQALRTLVPGASEQTLDKMTKSGDKNKDGYISYGEFINLYRVLIDKVNHHGGPGDKCSPNPCQKNQLCRNCRNTKGYCCETISTVPSKTPVGLLTAAERAQVNNIFTALNTNKDKGVSHQEFYLLLSAVRQTMGHDTKLYGEVYNYLVAHADTNHDKIVSYSEFLKACQVLKSKDPKSFPLFLKSATKLKPLVLGDPCTRYGSGHKVCPAGSACQRQRVIVESGSGSKKRTYTSYRYFCSAVTTTKKPVTNVKAGQPCSYGYCKSGCRKCAKGLLCRRKSYHFGDSSSTVSLGVCTPRTCKDCTTAHGTWMTNRCYFGTPGVADGVMFTKPAQCEHYDAARKAKCYTHHDCKSCISSSIHKKYGALCGWANGFGSSGSCQRNTGTFMLPLFTSAHKCPKVVVVHGRE